MEEENVPNWLSGIVAKNRAEYEQFMQKVQAKHREFMQWMQASHEEFIKKILQQTAILDTKNSMSTSPTSIIEETYSNMQQDAGGRKGICIKEHSSSETENPKNFQEEDGGKNEGEESGRGLSSFSLRTTNLFAPHTGSSSSTCCSASMSFTPSISIGASPIAAINSTSASGFKKSTSRQKSSFRGFGSPNPTQSSSSGSPFGATSTSVFGSTSVSAFGSKTSSFSVMNATALSTPSISVSKPSSLHPSEFFVNRCASCPRNTSCQTEPAFTFGAAIHPANSVTSIPAFSSTSVAESGIMTASFGAPSTSTSKASSMYSFKFCSSPDFGASATTVGATPTTIFATSSPTSTCQTEPTQPFVTSIQPASLPAFGSTSIPAFGTTTSFHATTVPAFGTPIFTASEASIMPSFDFCSTPAFDLSAATFRGTAPTFRFNASPSGSQGSKLGTQCSTSTFITEAFGRIPSGNLCGSGLTSYKATNEPAHWQTQGKLISISAMPEFEDQSHEELRWADYQLGNYVTRNMTRKTCFASRRTKRVSRHERPFPSRF